MLSQLSRIIALACLYPIVLCHQSKQQSLSTIIIRANFNALDSALNPGMAMWQQMYMTNMMMMNAQQQMMNGGGYGANGMTGTNPYSMYNTAAPLGQVKQAAKKK